MLGKELISQIETRFRQRRGISWENWVEKKKDIVLEHDYPLDNFHISGAELLKIIKDEKIKILMKDVC